MKKKLFFILVLVLVFGFWFNFFSFAEAKEKKYYKIQPQIIKTKKIEEEKNFIGNSCYFIKNQILYKVGGKNYFRYINIPKIIYFLQSTKSFDKQGNIIYSEFLFQTEIPKIKVKIIKINDNEYLKILKEQ